MIKKIASHLKRKTTIAAIAGLIIVCGGLWLWQHIAFKHFEDAYDSYTTASDIQQNAAYTPGSTSNELRQELDNTLALILAKETSVKDRIELAQHGLDLLKMMNAEVDDIGTAAPAVTAGIEKVTASANETGNIYRRGKMLSLMQEAKDQMDIIENIRGYSYRANFETQQIFNRILSDKGQLTDAYITELNDQLPAVEDQFDKRQNLYTNLDDSVFHMQQEIAKLEGRG